MLKMKKVSGVGQAPKTFQLLFLLEYYMNASDLTSPLIEGLVYAPIYKKGASMRSGRKATGKNPFEESWDRDFDKADVELALNKNADLQAVGLYTGIRAKGIVK